jgi:2-aminoadipate transaminase
MSAALSPGFRPASRTGRFKPSAIREILKTTASSDVISFAGGLPAPELFPVDEVRRAAEETLLEDGPGALQYGVTEGFPPLREWICEHLAIASGLDVSPDRVLVTSGSQQGLDLAARVLLDPGDTVLVENPGYLGALQCFASYEARVVGVRTDEQGLDPGELRRALESCPQKPKLIYLIPNFQNPTGTSLAADRRAAVAALAGTFGVPILEDDPYGSLRYRGKAAPALASMPGAHDWIYLGTASKILAPGLRVAWLAASDRALVERLVSAKQAADLHTSSLTQRLVWRCFRRPGFLSGHVQRLRAAYGLRLEAMLAALERHLPGCRWTRPDGGMFLWVELPRSVDAHSLLEIVMTKNVAFVPGEPFWVGLPRRNTLRLNFSNAGDEAIEEGIRRLALALKES